MLLTLSISLSISLPLSALITSRPTYGQTTDGQTDRLLNSIKILLETFHRHQLGQSAQLWLNAKSCGWTSCVRIMSTAAVY